MKMIFDPVTEFLNRVAWVLWATLWISLSLGVGQEALDVSVQPIAAEMATLSRIAAILLIGCVILQLVRQIFYSHVGPPLVRVARWIILGATSIFAFRMVYMISVYGGAPSSRAALVGVSLLALGISLNSVGMMQYSYFQEKQQKEKEEGEELLKWNNSWRQS